MSNDRFLWNEEDIEIVKEGRKAEDLYVPAAESARFVQRAEEE